MMRKTLSRWLMRVFEGTEKIPDSCRGAVLAIGNFDGVHKGHQALIACAQRKAERSGHPLGVLTFSPHPRRFFNPDRPPEHITSKTQQLRLLDELGVDFTGIEVFDQTMAACSAEDFASDILVKKYGVSAVAVGFNFRFGHKRAGDTVLLEKLGRQYGFDVIIVEPQGRDNEIWSSSLIRERIKSGDFESAAHMLGRPWEIESDVIHGDKRGREFGFPTANQTLGDYICPPFGIYAARAVLGDEIFYGVSSLGLRPMFRVDQPLLETFLFDFDRDIYGKALRVRPLVYLRAEQAFPSRAELVEQIERDVKAAKAALKEFESNEKYG